jgi:hypothetical protein
MIKYFLIQSLLTITFFFLWILVGSFSDGDVGMTPYNVLIVVSLQFAIGTALYLLIGKRSNVNRYLTIILYVALYEVVFYLFSGSSALFNMFNDGFSGAIYRGYFLSSIFAGCITLLLIYLLCSKEGIKK